MKAQVGDELVVKGRHVGDPDRTGVIIEVIGQAGGPPYLVRWSDGHESSFFPTSGTVAQHISLPARERPGRRRRELARETFAGGGSRRWSSSRNRSTGSSFPGTGGCWCPAARHDRKAGRTAVVAGAHD